MQHIRIKINKVVMTFVTNAGIRLYIFFEKVCLIANEILQGIPGRIVLILETGANST